jgi:lysophospholipid hydrolase
MELPTESSHRSAATATSKSMSKFEEQRRRVINSLLEKRRAILHTLRRRQKQWLSRRTRQVADWAEQQSWAQGFYHVTLPPSSSYRNGKLPEELESCGFGRLARLMTGTAVGLVLGGGGARGLAHLGVIAALEEAGVTLDMVSGTSQVLRN